MATLWRIRYKIYSNTQNRHKKKHLVFFLLTGHHKYTHTHTHIYIYIYMCVCVFIYIYIYTHTHTYIHTHTTENVNLVSTITQQRFRQFASGNAVLSVMHNVFFLLLRIWLLFSDIAFLYSPRLQTTCRYSFVSSLHYLLELYCLLLELPSVCLK